MRVVIKAVISFFLFIIAIPIFASVNGVPLLKLALMAGLIAGFVAIWKYNPDDNNDDHKLDKS